MAQYNLRNPAVKRLMREAEELKNPTSEYFAQPLEDNLFEWHFTIRGPTNSDFEGGVYHGRITLPPDYPMKPPSIILLTPNGRFEINRKICLSISGHHPESWQPSWSIRTALLAIIGFMPTHGNGAIGSLDYTPEERRQLALKSQQWKCPECGLIKDVLIPEGEESLDSGNEVDDQLDSEQESEPMVNQPSSSSITPSSLSDDKDLILDVQSSVEPEGSQSTSDSGMSAENPITEDIDAQEGIENASVLRQRHFSPPEERPSSDTPEANKKEARAGCLSLIAIWTISIILGILIIRRIFF